MKNTYLYKSNNTNLNYITHTQPAKKEEEVEEYSFRGNKDFNSNLNSHTSPKNEKNQKNEKKVELNSTCNNKYYITTEI